MSDRTDEARQLVGGMTGMNGGRACAGGYAFHAGAVESLKLCKYRMGGAA